MRSTYQKYIKHVDNNTLQQIVGRPEYQEKRENKRGDKNELQLSEFIFYAIVSYARALQAALHSTSLHFTSTDLMKLRSTQRGTPTILVNFFTQLTFLSNLIN